MTTLPAPHTAGPRASGAPLLGRVRARVPAVAALLGALRRAAA